MEAEKLMIVFYWEVKAKVKINAGRRPTRTKEYAVTAADAELALHTAMFLGEQMGNVKEIVRLEATRIAFAFVPGQGPMLPEEALGPIWEDLQKRQEIPCVQN